MAKRSTRSSSKSNRKLRGNSRKAPAHGKKSSARKTSARSTVARRKGGSARKRNDQEALGMNPGQDTGISKMASNMRKGLQRIVSPRSRRSSSQRVSRSNSRSRKSA